MSTSALSVEDIAVHFGGLRAVDGVTMSIPVGARHGILGPNGAGKTTLFNAITGLVPIAGGSVWLGDEDLTTKSPAIRSRMGLGRTYQITNLMPTLSTFENVLLGSLSCLGQRSDWWRSYAGNREASERTFEILEDTGLTKFSDTLISELSYGDTRRVEIALALAAAPSVLLLDEPTAGLSIAERDSIVTLLLRIATDLTTVIIEHDMEVMFALADTITVLERGSEVVTGTVAEIKADPTVKEIYLGPE